MTCPEPAQLREIDSRLLELVGAGKITAEDAGNAYREFLRAVKRLGKLSSGEVAARRRKWERQFLRAVKRLGKLSSGEVAARRRKWERQR